MRVVQIVQYYVHIVFAKASSLNEVLDLKKVKTDLLSFLAELFSCKTEVFWQGTWSESLSHAHLVLNLLSLSFSSR